MCAPSQSRSKVVWRHLLINVLRHFRVRSRIPHTQVTQENFVRNGHERIHKNTIAIVSFDITGFNLYIGTYSLWYIPIFRNYLGILPSFSGSLLSFGYGSVRQSSLFLIFAVVKSERRNLFDNMDVCIFLTKIISKWRNTKNVNVLNDAVMLDTANQLFNMATRRSSSSRWWVAFLRWI